MASPMSDGVSAMTIPAAVMALERVPAQIRKDGGVARASDPQMVESIQQSVSIPVMAKCRIGHFMEARILEAYERRPPDYIVLVLPSNPADYGYKSFARDYGARIYRWIEANYRQVPAPTEPTYPLVLLERKP